MRYELTKDLETGNALIDTEHRQLLKAASDLMEACSQGQGRSQLEPVIDFLTSYVNKHFGDEEGLQVRSKYPGYMSHRQFHESYKQQLGAVALDMKNQGPTIAILSRLNQHVGLLLNHIKIEDKKLASHVKQSGM